MQRKTMLEEFWSHATGWNVVLKDYSYAIRFNAPEKKARQPPDVLPEAVESGKGQRYLESTS